MNNDTYANYHNCHVALCSCCNYSNSISISSPTSFSLSNIRVSDSLFFPITQTQIYHHSSFFSHFAVFYSYDFPFLAGTCVCSRFFKVYTATYNYFPIHRISYLKYTHRKLNLLIFILQFFVFIIEFVVKQKLSQLT